MIINKFYSLSLIVFFFVPTIVFAQSSEGFFSLSPAKTEINIEPGQTLYIPFTLVNHLGRPAIFNVLFEDIIAPNDPAIAFEIKKTTSNPYALEPYINLDEPGLSLKSGEERRFSIAVSIPSDSLPGSRHGVLLVTTEALDTTTETKTISRLGGIVLVKVAGVKKEQGQLDIFQIIGKSLISGPPIRFQIAFKNEGNTYLNPYGLIEIKNLITQSKRNIVVDPWFVLPQSERWREMVVSEGQWGGLYQATLKLNRGYQDVIDSQKTNFIVIPIWFIISSIVIFSFLLGVGIFMLKSKMNNQ